MVSFTINSTTWKWSICNNPVVGVSYRDDWTGYGSFNCIVVP
jgi:hypothetical protein